MACLALMLAGCSAEVAMFRADSSWWNRGRDIEPLAFRPADADGLLGPEGCPPPVNPEARPFGLGMTECDLVRQLGPTENVVIGSNDRAQRTAVITYLQGDRPGIYHFASGVMVSIERAPEPQQQRRRPPQRVRQ